MKRTMLASVAILGLLAGPALAQDAAATAEGGQSIQDTAIQSAQGAGFADAQPLEGALVLQATSPTGTPILLVVGPQGELLALANMIALPGAQGSAGAGTEAGGTDAAAGGGAEGGAEPEAGEAAEGGFMETQAAPASPGMWATETIQGELQRLQGGGITSTATGNTTGGSEGGESGGDAATTSP